MSRSNSTFDVLRHDSIFDIKNPVRELAVFLSLGVVGSAICIVGVLGNIINLYVFLKMGFKDTINISFFGLTISDCGHLLTQLWINLMYVPAFKNLEMPFDPAENGFRHVTGAWPHIYFSRVSGLITAYATFARCLCIAMPLKVKQILTPRRTEIVTAFIFLMVLAMVFPVFPANPMGWRFSATKNRSVYGVRALRINGRVDSISYTLCNVCGYFSFCTTIASTSVLVNSLKTKAKWRQTAASGLSNSTASAISRDERVIKMMVTISVVFILCYLPNTVIYMTTIAFNDFSVNGRYQNLFFIVASLTWDLEAINSSVNVLVYLKMNSKYRSIALELFHWTSCTWSASKQAKMVP